MFATRVAEEGGGGVHYHHHYDHVDKGWSEAGIGWLASGPKMREVCLPHHKKQRSAFPSHRLMSYRETMERGPCQRVSLDSQSIPLYGLVRQGSHFLDSPPNRLGR